MTVIALADMRGNLMIAAMMLAGGVLYVLFLARKKRGGSAAARWIPWVSLFTGPVLGPAYWAVEVHFGHPALYPLPSDSRELLVAGLVIGTFAGCVASLVFGTALHLRHRRES